MNTFLNEIAKIDEESSEGPYLEFLLQYKFDITNFHFFFEGYEDSSYYSSVLNSIIRQDSFEYIGKGKYRLYEIHETINWNKFNKNRVLFFTDRDYTELVGEILKSDENIYITDFYSIENHVVTTKILDRILLDIFHLPSIKKRRKLTEKFEEEYQKFFRAILYLTAWIIYLKRSKIKVVLNEIDLGKLFKFNQDISFKSKNGKQTKYLEQVTGIKTPNNSWGSILKIINEIRQLDPKLIIRGKFEIWFFSQFLLHLKISLDLKVKTHITQANCVEICGPRIEPPDSLLGFINLNYSKMGLA